MSREARAARRQVTGWHCEEEGAGKPASRRRITRAFRASRGRDRLCPTRGPPWAGGSRQAERFSGVARLAIGAHRPASACFLIAWCSRKTGIHFCAPCSRHHRPTLSPAASPPVRVTGRPDRRGEGDYAGGGRSGDKCGSAGSAEWEGLDEAVPRASGIHPCHDRA